jgi:nickel-dependent lactate racemase
MKVHLPYGKSGLDVVLPDYADVFLPAHSPPLSDAGAAVREALLSPVKSRPLRELLRPGDSVAVVISDITRPVPNRVIVPPVLETLAGAGVPRERTKIIVGTGMHRPSTREERETMLGAEIAGAYPVVDHVARDESTHAFLETTKRGVEVWLNRDYLRADVKILTGFIEPHIFAGFSGGGKGVLPALAGAKTILQNHSFEMLAHPRSKWCVAKGNPIFEEARSVAIASRPTFLLNVTQNERQEITGVFAGELAAAHDAGMAQAARQALTSIPHLYDIVVSTNMGWAADLNLYQSMKGMSVAGEAVKPAGAIVLAAECAEGVGNDDFANILFSEASFEALMAKIGASGFAADEQWGVQCMGMVASKAEVWVKSCMSRELTEKAHMRYCADVGETVSTLAAEFRRRNGADPSIAVFPYGQLTVPKIQV